VQFWLGTHKVNWLGKAEFRDVPLFVSAVRLRTIKKKFPRAVGRYAVDSGGFSELFQRGWWTVTPAQYVAELRKWWREIGPFDWCAVQDWMCEPIVREGGLVGKHRVPGTKLSVRSHQMLTVRSYLELTALAPELPWVPVLQGWESDDYRRHVDQYAAWGVDLTALPLVGLGSVCRRQGTAEAQRIAHRLAGLGIDLHLFGFKIKGLRRCAGLASSADSLAWSYSARAVWARTRRQMLPDCTHRGGCGNCQDYALWWRENKVLPLLRQPASLFD
jgi:hypothetical protein